MYLHGNGNLIAGLENALEGKSAGEDFKVSIPPRDAYGEWEKEKLMEVLKSEFGSIDDLKVGTQLSAGDGEEDNLVTITKIDGENVTVDENHPLAGKTLNFDVTW